MTKRSAVTVVLLSCITFGIYALIWMINTKEEMNAKGAGIPTGWFLVIPGLNVFWLWKWANGVQHVTGGKTSGVMMFAMMAFLGPIGQFMAQNAFNEIG
jgi:hypothetical protein